MGMPFAGHAGAKPPFGHGMFIFARQSPLAGVNIENFASASATKRVSCSCFQNAHRDMLAFAVRLKTEIFHYHEIFRVGFQQPLPCGSPCRYVRLSKSVICSPSPAAPMASQAMPSPRPVKPSFSVVVALTLTSSMATQIFSDKHAHLWDVRQHLRCLSNDRHVNVAEGVAWPEYGAGLRAAVLRLSAPF